MAKFKVLRGTVILGKPYSVGDEVEMEAKSQSAVELVAMGRIKLNATSVAEDVPVTNRGVGLDDTIAAPVKRGRKAK